MRMKFKRAVIPSQHDIAGTIAHRQRLFLRELKVRIAQYGQGMRGNSHAYALDPNQPPSFARRFRSRANFVRFEQSCTARSQCSSAARRMNLRVSSRLQMGEM